MIVIDTAVLIDHLRDHSPAVDLLDATLAQGRPVTASVVSRLELLRGMRSHERRATQGLLDALRWHDVTPTIADRAGALARSYRASHQGIDPLDFLIAATAIELGADLWTLNLKHFPMFDGLTTPY